MLVANSQKIECTIDPGCQIITMAEAECHSLGLAYDSCIWLNMESANGNCDWSLGLTRNVPFHNSDNVLYLLSARLPILFSLVGHSTSIVEHNLLKSKNPLSIYSASILVEPSLASSIISDIPDPPLISIEPTTDQTSHLALKSHKQTTGKKYKLVVLKTKPIMGELPGKFCVI